ncbi:MAG: aspartate kinase [Bacteroidota bacterium]
MPLHVLKFGGTSVGAPTALSNAAQIVARAAAEAQVVVVVSAASGVTDTLAHAVAALDGTGSDAGPHVARVRDRYARLAAAALSRDGLRRYEVALGIHTAALGRVLREVSGECATFALRDAALAVGERLSAPLVAALLSETKLDAQPVDAARLVRTDDRHGVASVDALATYPALRAWHRALRPGVVPVVTGYLGSTDRGTVTTLGRGGSDYTAGLVAAALGADLLERWTDTDGLYDDDPNLNPDAAPVPTLRLDEAAALARQGRLGMHPRALDPLVGTATRVRVRSTAAPDAPGSWLLPTSADASPADSLTPEPAHASTP